MPDRLTRPVSVSDVIAACRTLPEPGWHRLMHDHPRPKHAATLLPIIDVDGVASIVITQRARSLDHGGDWVFPGGRVDDTDGSHAEAARREAAEELGIDVDDIEVVGQLATWGPIITGYVIETYVGVVSPGVTFAPDAGEVSGIAVLAITDLLDPARQHRAPIESFARHELGLVEELGLTPTIGDLRHYRVRDGEYLWGMQADMLQELLGHLTDGHHDF